MGFTTNNTAAGALTTETAIPNSPVACDRRFTLVVDDEPAISQLLKRLLSSIAPKVRIDMATNGLEAVKAFERKHHCLLIMDIEMPEMDGCRAFDEIREMCSRRNWNMPAVVFCSGSPNAGRVQKRVEQNVREYCFLTKPLHFATFVHAVKSRLGLEDVPAT